MLGLAYRRRRQELADKGWLLSDADRVTGDAPKSTATVIPSPARRENPELARAWVHKARRTRRRASKSSRQTRPATDGERHRRRIS